MTSYIEKFAMYRSTNQVIESNSIKHLRKGKATCCVMHPILQATILKFLLILLWNTLMVTNRHSTT